MIPFYFQLHITNQCGMNCKHCYINEKDRNTTMSLAKCLRVIDQMVNFCKELKRRPFLVITGGDPTNHSEFPAIMEKVSQEKIEFSILGNPTNINVITAAWLKHLGCRQYQLSLDGLEATHNSIRCPDSFQKTLEAIKILRSADIKVAIMSTVSAVNYREILPLMNFLLNETRINQYSFARYCPSDHDDAAKHNVDAQEYRSLLDSVWQVLKGNEKWKQRFFFKDHLWKLFFYEQGLLQIKTDEKTIVSGCNCGFNHLTILPDGDVQACRRFESRIGNAHKSNLTNLFLFKAKKYRAIDDLEKCGKCELLHYCRGCLAVAHGTYGDFRKPDPYCWK